MPIYANFLATPLDWRQFGARYSPYYLPPLFTIEETRGDAEMIGRCLYVYKSRLVGRECLVQLTAAMQCVMKEGRL